MNAPIPESVVSDQAHGIAKKELALLPDFWEDRVGILTF
jgi:hypothetical protein